MNDSEIEQEIQAKGKTAPRITPADIEASIASEHYFSAWDGINGAMAAGNLTQRHADTDTANGQLPPASTPYEAATQVTICLIVMRNGHKIVGVNTGAVSATNFDAELARKLSRQNATDQIWPMLGYELRTQLARPVLTEGDAQADLNGTPRPDFYAD